GLSRSVASRRRCCKGNPHMRAKTPAAPNPAGYSGTPLPKKLGIRPQMKVRLIGAPDDFGQTLGALPSAVELCDGGAREAGLTVWFVRAARELKHGIRRAQKCAEQGTVWIAWPKKASGIACDFSENDVRNAGLAVGLV